MYESHRRRLPGGSLRRTDQKHQEAYKSKLTSRRRMGTLTASAWNGSALWYLVTALHVVAVDPCDPDTPKSVYQPASPDKVADLSSWIPRLNRFPLVMLQYVNTSMRVTLPLRCTMRAGLQLWWNQNVAIKCFSWAQLPANRCRPLSWRR